jgi:acyl carrier protein
MPDHGTNGHGANGYQANGYEANGYETAAYDANGYGAVAHEANGFREFDAPPPQSPLPSPPPPYAGEADSWLVALQEIQRQTSEAHAAYQHALADGHAAYLRTSEATLSGMVAALDGTGRLPGVGRPPAPPSAPRLPRTPPVRSQLPAPVVAPLPAPVVAPLPAPVVAPLPAPVAPLPVPAPSPAPSAATIEPSNTDLEDVVISVIADLTGYPVDLLQPDMELEHDLGIDSIKRVQILSRVRDRVPDLPSVDPAHLAALSSIGETVTYLRRQGSDRQAGSSTDAEGEPSPVSLSN